MAMGLNVLEVTLGAGIGGEESMVVGLFSLAL